MKYQLQFVGPANKVSFYIAPCGNILQRPELFNAEAPVPHSQGSVPDGIPLLNHAEATAVLESANKSESSIKDAVLAMFGKRISPDAYERIDDYNEIFDHEEHVAAPVPKSPSRSNGAIRASGTGSP
jgi:hypothetical protein